MIFHYVYLYYSFFIHLSIGRYVGCFYISAIMNNATINMSYFYEGVISFPLGIFPEERLLDHMVVLFLISLVHAIFHNGYNNLHSYGQYISVPLYALTKICYLLTFC